MADTRTTGAAGVLVAGAGPVGLSAAAELRRHGVRCRIVDRLPRRLPYAKAVGIQPRTLEIWDRMGLVRTVLEAATVLRGQFTYVDGEETGRVELVLPPEVPYHFASLPQYETERILEEYLAGLGTAVERGTELVSFAQDPDGVTVLLRAADGAEEELRTGWLIGCDGAHSTVRKGLGLAFEGDAFPEEYMLGDVRADWDLPPGYGVRSVHRAADGSVDDALVCIPLPGRGRYRMSMTVPPELSARHGTSSGRDEAAHGLEGGRAPELAHLQAAVDRLSPRPAVLSALRWSSVFRISHRIVERYGEGRAFVAGDAAHIHPPTGAQGMNTGIQDAVNLAWKLALVVRGEAGTRLLDSYDAERRPVGKEVVGRTVHHARHGIGGRGEDPRTVALREAQLLVAHRDSPLSVGPYGPVGAPQPGDRAPDCAGFSLPPAAHPLRLLDVLRGRAGHVVLVYGPDAVGLGQAAGAVAARWAPRGGHGPDVVAVLARDRSPDVLGALDVPACHDAAGEFARLYRPDGPTGFVIRPDGHLAARFPLTDTATALADVRRSLSLRE